MGFRGEALASMTYVGHVTVTTITKGHLHGYRVSYRDGVMESEPKACAAVKGTQIMVLWTPCIPLWAWHSTNSFFHISSFWVGSYAQVRKEFDISNLTGWSCMRSNGFYAHLMMELMFNCAFWVELFLGFFHFILFVCLLLGGEFVLQHDCSKEDTAKFFWWLYKNCWFAKPDGHSPHKCELLLQKGWLLEWKKFVPNIFNLFFNIFYNLALRYCKVLFIYLFIVNILSTELLEQMFTLLLHRQGLILSELYMECPLLVI